MLLKIDSLSLMANDNYVIQDFSLEINKGEIIALTGRSGSGKTSVAMAILGLLSPGITQAKGEIHWYAPEGDLSLPDNISSWPYLRGSHIGFTQQDVYGAFDPILRMGEQMKMVVTERLIKSVANIEQELRLRMEEVGLTDVDRLWNSYPHQLSGGQLQRCQICMAIVIQPELLIADEPTSAVDKINQTELLDGFSMLREKYGMAILCITHEVAVVQYLADREINIGITDSVEGDKVVTENKERMAIGPSILEATGLTYAYQFGGLMSKKGSIVGPIDFVLHRGQCLGVIGESGSGKSTLAQLLVGLLEPENGKLSLEGKEIDFAKPSDIQQLRSKVQLVMQDGRGSLHPYFTVGRLLNEVVAKENLSKDEIERAINTVLQDVDLPEQILHRKPGSLSGGECLRVSMARAFLMKPQVLICDESTSSLDPSTRDNILDLLRHLMDSKSLSILFISHDEHLIRAMADTILVMEAGLVVEQGNSKDLILNPAHTLTKKIFEGRATSAGGKHP